MSKKNKTKTDRTGTGVQTGFYIFFTALIVVLPLIYSDKILDPSLLPRLLTLSLVLVLFLLPLFSRKFFRKQNTAVLRNPLYLFMLAYALITAVSMFFAINYREGFYDTAKSFVMLILAAVAGVFFVSNPGWYKKIPLLVLVSAAISLLIGFNQYLNEVLLSTSELLPDGRPVIYLVDGLMAHKNQYAISLLLMLPFLGFGIYNSRGLFRPAFILITTLTVLMLIILETRSTWVGLILGSAAAVFSILGFGKFFGVGAKVRKSLLGLSLLVALALAVGVSFAGRDNPDSFFSRLRSITDPGAGNNVYRLKIWDLTTKMIADKPLQGVGAGNWKINSAYYFADYDFSKSQLNWIRPHNDFLWVFSEKGIIGFLAFASIFVYAVFLILKVLGSEISRDRKIYILLMFAGITGYVAVSIFTFPLERINHQVYLMLMLAGIIGIHYETKPPQPVRINRLALVVPALILLVFSISYSISVMKLETKVKQARMAQFAGNWNKMLQLSVDLPTTFRNIDAEAVPVAWYAGLAHASMNQPDKALPYYLRASTQHPTRVMVLNNLGKTYIDLGRITEGRQAIEKALEILPDYPEALTNLSASYYAEKDYTNALKYLRQIPPPNRTEIVNSNIRALTGIIRNQEENNRQPAENPGHRQ